MFRNIYRYAITLVLVSCIVTGNEFETDNEFAEFEEEVYEDSSTEGKNPTPQLDPIQTRKPDDTNKLKSPIDTKSIDADVVIEDEDDFDQFNDDDVEVDDDDNGNDEFVGVDDDEHDDTINRKKAVKSGTKKEPDLTIKAVPITVRYSWDSYWLELVMITGLFVYFANFVMGRGKNQRIAEEWFHAHKALLRDNFALVGDDGSVELSDEITGPCKESESIYTLWCSGRACCEGMLVELKLIKRQDLVSVLSQMVRPTSDQLHVKITMNSSDMDTFIFCVAQKRTAQYLHREMTDLSVFCAERRACELLPAQFQVISEMGEVTNALIDTKLVHFFDKYADCIDYMHFSDQYSGTKQQGDEGQSTATTSNNNNTNNSSNNNNNNNTGDSQGPASTNRPTDVKKMLCFGFNLPIQHRYGGGGTTAEAIQKTAALMQMVFYCLEKVPRFRLSREGRVKADRKRKKVEEVYLRTVHQQRAEAAAQRKETKLRLEKERVMADEDPERQRRWEEKQQKKQAKKRGPKMKQLKVKAL